LREFEDNFDSFKKDRVEPAQPDFQQEKFRLHRLNPSCVKTFGLSVEKRQISKSVVVENGHVCIADRMNLQICCGGNGT